MEKKFFTVMEFCEELGGIITRSQVYRMINAGEIPVRKIGRKTVIPAAWVQDYINMPCECVRKGA